MTQRRQRELSRSETDESIQNHGQHSPPERAPDESSPSSGDGDPGQSHSTDHIETPRGAGEQHLPSGYARPVNDKHVIDVGFEPSNTEAAVEASTEAAAYARRAAEGSSSHAEPQDSGIIPPERGVPAIPEASPMGRVGPDHEGTNTHQTSAPGDGDGSKKIRVTLGSAIQAEISQAILDGTIENFIDKVRGFIQSLFRLLETTDSGAEVLGNLVRRVREELQREIEVEEQAAGSSPGGGDATGLGSGPETGGAPGSQGSKVAGLDPAMLRLMWSLFKTPEFQQFTAKMIAQSLRGGLKQPLSSNQSSVQ
ncbi:MAG TPA: hypothetical protein GX507_07555 [Clostridia bacterium]|nr:hypothetical protein [Clostridia bacterium]